MMKIMQTHRDIIQAFGGVTKFAEATGINKRTAQSMSDRDSIAPGRWQIVADAAKTKGLRGITFAKLAELGAKKQERSSAPASATQSS